MDKLWMLALAMGAVAIGIKSIPLMFFKKKIKNRFLQSFLAYIPIAVMTAIVIPEVFSSTSSVVSATIGFVVAVAVAYFGQGLAVVMLSSVASVFIVEQIMRYMGHL